MFQLLDDANPYMYSCGENGMFYFVMEKPEDSGSSDSDIVQEEWVPEYKIYYQTYDKGPTTLYGSIEGGSIGDITQVERNNKLYPVILKLEDEETRIIEINANGKQIVKLTLDSVFHTYEQVEELLALADEYVISRGNEIYLLDKQGRIVKSADVEYSILELLGMSSEGDAIYALAYDKRSSDYEQYLLVVDKETFSLRDAIRLDEKVTKVYPFEDGLLSIYDNRIVFWHLGKDDAETVIDLDRQDIMSSDIKYIYGSANAYKIVTLDNTLGCLMTLTEKEETETISDDRFTEDGRRIVQVAVTDDYLYDMNFHAKLYNKTSENAYIEVVVLNEPMEFYLGKGNKPDVIGLNWGTDSESFIEKNALANLVPLAENQDKYSFDSVLPKIKEILEYDNGESIYYISPYFQLLLRTSDGTEYDENGKCDIVEYMLWLDRYMKELDVYGSHDHTYWGPKYWLYANLGYFYDEEKATVDFNSDSFKNMLRTYKETSGRRKGQIEDAYGFSVDYGKLAFSMIAEGTGWFIRFWKSQLLLPNVELKGVPGMDGEDHVYLNMTGGLAIMEYSDCKQEAFDFVMNFASLNEHLLNGTPESWYNHMEDYGRFYTFADNFEETIQGATWEFSSLTLTDEDIEEVRHLIDIAEPDTQTRHIIFDMMLEEMDRYLNGNKDLDSACEILSSRVRLYLQERQ